MSKIGSIVGAAFILIQCNSLNGATLSYQEGDGGVYSNTHASFVTSGSPNLNYGNGVKLQTWNTFQMRLSFIKFEDIFGISTGQIPYFSVINSATLQLRVINNGTSKSDNLQAIHLLYTDFDESSVTWNTFGSIPGGVAGTDWDPIALDEFTPAIQGIDYIVDLTSAVQQWSNQAVPNYGIIIISSGDDLLELRSDDTSDAPILSVTFNEDNAIPEPFSVFLFSSGLIGLSLRRKR